MISSFVSLKKNTELVFSSIKNEKPILTIIIPTYNRYKGLLDALNSIRYIEDKNKIAVIIIDNASIDYDFNNISKLLKSIEIDHSIYRNEMNYGSGYSFNIGVNLAKSDHIMYLFDDDLLRPEINHAIKEIKNYPEGLYFFHKFKLKKNKSYSARTKLSVWVRNTLNFFAAHKLRIDYQSILMTVPSFIGAIYNKEAFMKLKGFDLKTGPTGDYEFTIRYWRKYGILRYKYQVIDYFHGENDSSNSETFNLFPVDNYKYRLELLDMIALDGKTKSKFRTFIRERRVFEEKQLTGLLKVKHIIISIKNYLNLI